MSENGVVHLVGAGPGDPGLATKRALDLIACADVIVYDRLISRRLLEGAQPDAELIYVGKEPGNPSKTQDEINALLVEHGSKGKQVVRLKGGDPFVFGRGAEEAAALRDAGIEFRVVPGVTAGIAAPAYAGISVTQRNEASAVAFVTAHEDPDKPETAIDWNALASFPGTLVFYMGVKRLPALSQQLIASGRAADEPAAVIERGTFSSQRTVSGPLAEIAEIATREGISPPAITVVGPTVASREQLAWFERSPLHGKKVAVTRARAQASALTERLEALGAEVIEAPSIRIVPTIETEEVGEVVTRLVEGEYNIACVTSPNGAELLFEAVALKGRDARAFAGTSLAAIGPGTAATLLERGLRADIVARHSIGDALAQELVDAGVAGKRVLVARAKEAREVLPRLLGEAGAKVAEVALYETVGQPLDEAARAALEGADYLTFTSSSTVRFFLDANGGAVPEGARIASIGPITTATATDAGLRVDVESERHDVDGLVEALIDDASG